MMRSRSHRVQRMTGHWPEPMVMPLVNAALLGRRLTRRTRA
jgi:hypothetical protein